MSADAESGRTDRRDLAVDLPSVTAAELRHLLVPASQPCDHSPRLCDLYVAAGRLGAGLPVDAAWLRAQLLDLADVLAILAAP